ncbi:hypothetical protein BDK51DRAFT_28582, partial [Blyttiomyces helicus]
MFAWTFKQGILVMCRLLCKAIIAASEGDSGRPNFAVSRITHLNAVSASSQKTQSQRHCMRVSPTTNNYRFVAAGQTIALLSEWWTRAEGEGGTHRWQKMGKYRNSRGEEENIETAGRGDKQATARSKPIGEDSGVAALELEEGTKLGRHYSEPGAMDGKLPSASSPAFLNQRSVQEGWLTGKNTAFGSRDTMQPKAQQSPELAKNTKLRVDSPVFQPTTKSITADSVHVAPFVPISAAPEPTYENGPAMESAPVHEAPYEHIDAGNSFYPGGQIPMGDMGPPPFGMSHQQVPVPDVASLNHPMGRMNLGTPMGDPNAPQPPNQYFHPNGPPEPYFFQHAQMGMMPSRQPLQYHLYTNPLPHISNVNTHQKTIHAFFMSDKLREELLRRSEAVQQVLDPVSAEQHRLPSELHVYHSFYPLDVEKSTKVFGYPNSVYKVIGSQDGKPYVMRRIEGDCEIFSSQGETWASQMADMQGSWDGTIFEIVEFSDGGERRGMGDGPRSRSHSALERTNRRLPPAIRQGFRLANEAAMSSIEAWRRLRHANIVSVREAFTTKAFGDHSLVFVYDYHPLSTTLFAKHFSNHPHGGAGLSEKVLWSYITQLASAIKTIHSVGLAARIIEPIRRGGGDLGKRRLLRKTQYETEDGDRGSGNSGGLRRLATERRGYIQYIDPRSPIRLGSCGIFDMLTYDGGKNVSHYQQDDLLHFGQLVVALACGSLGAVHNLPKSVDYIVRHYSVDMKNIILYLLSKPSSYKTIDDVIFMIGPRILHEINSAHHYNDFLEGELGRELENARLVRLLSKLGCINERPEFDMDRTWSETGDRYLLKLFRDYVFHQVDENGSPIIDMAHIIQCLNK